MNANWNLIYRGMPLEMHGNSRDDAIVELANSGQDKISAAFVVTKTVASYGALPYETKIPVYKIPAFTFLYLLGQPEQDGDRK
jgi:hypothetical protein